MKNLFLAHLNSLCEKAEKTHLSQQIFTQPVSPFSTSQFKKVVKEESSKNLQNKKDIAARIYENFQPNSK
jgi:hypothetical protein